jgi:hypothetical protein
LTRRKGKHHLGLDNTRPSIGALFKRQYRTSTLSLHLLDTYIRSPLILFSHPGSLHLSRQFSTLDHRLSRSPTHQGPQGLVTYTNELPGLCLTFLYTKRNHRGFIFESCRTASFISQRPSPSSIRSPCSISRKNDSFGIGLALRSRTNSDTASRPSTLDRQGITAHFAIPRTPKIQDELNLCSSHGARNS